MMRFSKTMAFVAKERVQWTLFFIEQFNKIFFKTTTAIMPRNYRGNGLKNSQIDAKKCSKIYVLCLSYFDKAIVIKSLLKSIHDDAYFRR